MLIARYRSFILPSIQDLATCPNKLLGMYDHPTRQIAFEMDVLCIKS